LTNHIQISFSKLEPEQQELLTALLVDIGFEGFEETDGGLKAFINEKIYNKKLLQELAAEQQLSFSEELIPDQNWNAVWESNFQPVVVDDFVAIRAHFHEPIEKVEHEIVITPKMSFGTGHHATTYMMMQQMKEIDFTGKTVFDFGTGTGVLAILAEKLGARKIVAIDNDDWSIENAGENAERNRSEKIELMKADTGLRSEKFDIILANINKNVILDNLEVLVSQLSMDGILVLSGLLVEDEADILTAIASFSLQNRPKLEKNNWICLSFNR
jgi:ribosomal protein L11 methyltransferase